MNKDPVSIFLMSHFVVKLPIDFRQRLMMSFCLQTTGMIYGNVAVSYLRKDANANKFAAWPQKLSKTLSREFI